MISANVCLTQEEAVQEAIEHVIPPKEHRFWIYQTSEGYGYAGGTDFRKPIVPGIKVAAYTYLWGKWYLQNYID